MVSLPAEILLGIYLGLLVGIIPALASWALGFGFKYVTGVTLPGFGVVVLAVALAGVNGGLLALADESVVQGPNAPRLVTAILVVSMMSLYSHSKGDTMAVDIPRRLSLSSLRSERLSREFANLVSGGDEVQINVVGEVADMEGYPPLPEDLRTELRNAELTFPSDLRLEELETRMEDRLQTEYDLGDISVTIDERGRATVVAAPPFSGLSKRVSLDRHAVSVSGLVPTGLARGDEVTVITPDAQVRGTVISARSGEGTGGEKPSIDPLSNETPDEEIAKPVRAPTTDGGEGQVTVAVTRTDVQPLLRARDAKVVVESRGTRREYEVVSMLRRADRKFRRVAVRSGSRLQGLTLGPARLRETHDVSVLAVRKPGGWQIAPPGETVLEIGDEVFLVGERSKLDAFIDRPASSGSVPR